MSDCEFKTAEVDDRFADQPVQDTRTKNGPSTKSTKREICARCHRPKQRACLCFALPNIPLELQETAVVILQHPQELKHKINRSVPLLELCFAKSSSSIQLCVGRRFGDQTPPTIQTLLQPPNLPILIFPKVKEDDSTERVHTLEETKEKIYLWRKQQQESQPQERELGVNGSDHKNPKVVLIVLDATWKYAREMHLKNHRGDFYPSQMLRLGIDETDLPADFQPRRFIVRTIPNSSGHQGKTSAWMSTAECVAWILSQLEQQAQPNNRIYETVLRVLDAMAANYKSFQKSKEPKRQKRG